MNGSSANGNCSNVTTSTLSSLSRCNTPNSSVLFDGSIPITLAGLDGDVLASQLLTLQTTDQSHCRQQISLVVRLYFILNTVAMLEWGDLSW